MYCYIYDHDSVPEGLKNFMYVNTITYEHDTAPEGKEFHALAGNII